MLMFLFGQAVDSVRFQATIPTSFLQAVVLISVLFSKPLQYIWIFPIVCITQQPICDLRGGLSCILDFRVCGMLLNVKPVVVQLRGEPGVHKQLLSYLNSSPSIMLMMFSRSLGHPPPSPLPCTFCPLAGNPSLHFIYSTVVRVFYSCSKQVTGRQEKN